MKRFRQNVLPRPRPLSGVFLTNAACDACDHNPLNAERLQAVSDWISDYEAYWGKTLQSLKRYVEDER